MDRIIYKITHPFFRLYWKFFKPKTYGSRALFLHNGKILLTKNIDVAHWSLPGGKIDPGETPEQCIVRELKEELNVSNIKIDYTLGEYISKREAKRDTVYIFIITTDTPVFEKQWELDDAQWFELNDLPNNISPATQRRIGEYLRGQKDLKGDW